MNSVKINRKIKASVGGMTLIELLVVVSAMTVLAAVLWAPKNIQSDFRKAALTIARVHDLLGVAYQYRRLNGGWPERSNSCANFGRQSGNVAFGDFVSESPVTGWGTPISIDCRQDGKEYKLTYDVPSKWEDMLSGELESTRLRSRSGGWVEMETTMNIYGNNDALPQFVKSGEIQDGRVDIEKASCADSRIMIVPKSLCAERSSDDHDKKHTYGFYIHYSSSDNNFEFTVERLYRGLFDSDGDGVFSLENGRDPLPPTCDGSQKTRLKTWQQCVQ